MFFNKSIAPKPELTNRPAKSEPKEIEPPMNNSVIKILEAQLGINPIIEQYNGVK